jgi:hypothetical protein
MLYTSDMLSVSQDALTLWGRITDRMAVKPYAVWTPSDFADLAPRTAVDKALQRLAATDALRRIDRGLYDRPTVNQLTGRPSVPDYRELIGAVARREKVRYVLDGMTAANELGLTTAVPARIEVLIDARLKDITLGNQEICFKTAAPSRLYWAGHPAMRIVQALYWLQDTLADTEERARVTRRLHAFLTEPEYGHVLRDDLREGLSALPIWMQEFLRDLLGVTEKSV